MYLRPSRLLYEKQDLYLAQGWFRSFDDMKYTEYVCMENGAFGTVQIRLPLANYQRPKRMRKLSARVHREGLVHTIQKLSINQAKEVLFKHHRKRFDAQTSHTLEEYLNGSTGPDPIFNTYETCVYNQKGELVANSFFDVGKDSVASILCNFDSRYHKFSLGIYTMLLEINYAIGLGKSYYYPGYIFDCSTEFDYKLRVGKFEYQLPDGTWKWSFDREIVQPEKKNIFNNKINEAAVKVVASGFYCVKQINPFFFLAASNQQGNLVESPLFLSLRPKNVSHPKFMAIEYLKPVDTFRLVLVYSNLTYLDFISRFLREGNLIELESNFIQESVSTQNHHSIDSQQIPQVYSEDTFIALDEIARARDVEELLPFLEDL